MLLDCSHLKEFSEDAIIYLDDNTFGYINKEKIPYKDIVNKKIQIFSGYYKLNEKNLPVIYLFGRSTDGKKIRLKIENFLPYCYVDSKKETKYKLITNNSYVEKLLFKAPPVTVSKYREKIGRDKVYEADIPFVRRFMIDCGKFFTAEEPVYPKICYIDVEVNMPYSDDVISIAWSINGDDIKFKNLRRNESLEELWKDLEDIDIITAWNIDFDMKYIYRLAKSHGKEYLLKEVEKIDLGDLVRAIIIKEMPLWSLDDVAKEILGEEKLRIQTFPADLDDKTLEEYNKRDVELIVKIDKELGAFELYTVLAHASHCLIKDTISKSVLNDITVLNICHEHNYVLPSMKKDEKKLSYKGAFIYAKPGLYKNVGVFDISAMYPTIMIALNASILTKTDDENGDVIIAANGVKFKKKYDFTIDALKQFLELRREKKLEMRKYEKGSNEWKKLNYIQSALKTQAASLYGLYGWVTSRIYNREIAHAITSTGYELTSYLKRIVETELKRKVVYVHTDSLFIVLKPDDNPKMFEEYLNEKLKEYAELRGFQAIPKIELKDIFKKVYVHAKAQNIRLTMDGRIEITGLPVKKSDMPEWCSEVLLNVYKMLLNNKTTDEIISYVKSAISNELMHIHPDKLGKRIPFRKPISEYKTNSQHIKAILNSMKLFGLKAEVGRKYLMLPVKFKGKSMYIAFEKGKFPENGFKLDRVEYVRSNLVGKLSKILNIEEKTLLNILFNKRNIEEWGK